MDYLIAQINIFLDRLGGFSEGNITRIKEYLEIVRREEWNKPFKFMPKLKVPLDEEDWNAPQQLKFLIYRARLKRYTYNRLRVAYESHLLYKKDLPFKEDLPLRGDYAVKAMEGGRYSHYVYFLVQNFLNRTPIQLNEEYLVEPEEARMLGKKPSPLVKNTARRLSLASSIAAFAWKNTFSELGLGEGKIKEYNVWLKEHGFLPDIEPHLLKEVGVEPPFEVATRTEEWYRKLKEHAADALDSIGLKERFQRFVRDHR